MDLRLANLVIDLFLPVVDLDFEPGLFEQGRDLVGVIEVPIRDRQHDRLHRRQPQREGAGEVLDQDRDEALEAAEGLRVKVDDGPDRMQNKIRKAQMMKIPYMLVVGDKEQEGDAVAVRLRTGEDLKAMPVAQFIARAKLLIDDYALTL